MVDETENDPTAIWIRKQIESASQEIVDLGVIESQITQSRPIWSIPGKVVLGQLRAADELASFKWVIMFVLIISIHLPLQHPERR
jgi:hypothetical protein